MLKKENEMVAKPSQPETMLGIEETLTGGHKCTQMQIIFQNTSCHLL